MDASCSGGLLRTDFQVPYKVLFVLSTIGRAAALAVMLSELPAQQADQIVQVNRWYRHSSPS